MTGAGLRLGLGLYSARQGIDPQMDPHTDRRVDQLEASVWGSLGVGLFTRQSINAGWQAGEGEEGGMC